MAAEYDGMYISHMRDEGASMLEALEELITIAREAKIRAEIYHFKSSGQPNWHLFDQAVAMVEKAQGRGSADHRGYLHLSGGRHRSQCINTAMGPGRWFRSIR